jgi:hypothetical protein
MPRFLPQRLHPIFLPKSFFGFIQTPPARYKTGPETNM